VQLAELATALHAYEVRCRDRLSPGMQSAFDTGKAVLAVDYLAALDTRAAYEAALEAIFADYDVIMTAAAPGPAPRAEEGTGNPVFNGLWTFCGTPAVSLPLLASSDGLPIGVQLIARRGDDARLLRTARWLVARLGARPAPDR
jgi:Asp-tRNA(Asn)/Glu-tRNA(Gln) amidotransferase A subunit family amidase